MGTLKIIPGKLGGVKGDYFEIGITFSHWYDFLPI
jgi:hypothetical protein